MRPERGTRWLLGGMMLDEKDLTNGMKKVVGNVIIARAGSREELLEALRNDVYASDGVWDMEKVIACSLNGSLSEMTDFFRRSRSCLSKVFSDWDLDSDGQAIGQRVDRCRWITSAIVVGLMYIAV